MENISIPWARPSYLGKEKEYVLDALDSTWISGGPYVDKFETIISQFVKSQYVSSCSNGTSALMLALDAIKSDNRNEVIVPGFGYMAAANVAKVMGFTVKFADVKSDTWCIDVHAVEKIITEQTLAIIGIHTYGNLFDVSALMNLCQKYSIYLIEDAAEAMGSTYKDKCAGSIGHIGTLSFQATKMITTGEGGATLTSLKNLDERIKLNRSHGVSEIKYLHSIPGNNFRLTNMQAAVGVAQMENIEKAILARRKIAHRYRELLSDHPDFQLQKEEVDSDVVFWVTAICLNQQFSRKDRDKIIEMMSIKGIETRPGFYTHSDHTYFEIDPNTPVSEIIAERIIVLPAYNNLTKSEIDFISMSLKESLIELKDDKHES